MFKHVILLIFITLICAFIPKQADAGQWKYHVTSITVDTAGVNLEGFFQITINGYYYDTLNASTHYTQNFTFGTGTTLAGIIKQIKDKGTAYQTAITRFNAATAYEGAELDVPNPQ